MVIAVSDIADRLNQKARTLAAELLPNGHKAGNYWMASGIDDTGHSASLAVNLTGARIGHWVDHGNARAGEDKGDMLDLVRLKQCGGDVKRAVDWAKAHLGIEDDFKPDSRPKPSREEQQARVAEARARLEEREAQFEQERSVKAKRAKALFLGGGPIAGSPVELYLENRGIRRVAVDGELTWPGSLRYEPECWCRPVGAKVPAMLAGIFDAQGSQIGTHRTFLQRDRRRGWTKIDSPNAKMVLGNVRGGFVPIHKGSSGKSMREMREGEAVYVTEGLEDALTVRMHLPGARIVCGISLGNIGSIVLPERAGELVIVADRDSNPKAQDTLERSIAAQQARGMAVKLVFPPEGIKDMNDWHLALAAEKRKVG